MGGCCQQSQQADQKDAHQNPVQLKLMTSVAPAAVGIGIVAVVVELVVSPHAGIVLAVRSWTLQVHPVGAVSPVAPFMVITIEVQGPEASVIVPAVAPPAVAEGVQPVGA